MCTVLCAACSVKFSVCSVQCIAYCAQCTVRSVQQGCFLSDGPKSVFPSRFCDILEHKMWLILDDIKKYCPISDNIWVFFFGKIVLYQGNFWPCEASDNIGQADNIPLWLSNNIAQNGCFNTISFTLRVISPISGVQFVMGCVKCAGDTV